MKYTKYIRLALLLLCALIAITLVACGNPPTPPCEHDFQPDRFMVEPTCGELTEGVRLYVCSLCGESEERPVTNTQTQHSMESEITTPSTCTQTGVRTFTCKYCGFSRTSSIATLGGHVLDYAAAEVDYDNNTRLIPCTQCGEKVSGKAYTTYSEHGAVGDGETDDSNAIRAAHLYANAHGIDVWADAGASYYIGILDSTIIVKTNVNWRDALFIIDDALIAYDNDARNVNIFTIASDTPVQKLAVPEGMTLTKGQTNIGMTFDKPCMLYIANDVKEEYIYKRYGANENDGVPMQEVILVDEKGNVDPTTPIQYNYSGITTIRCYSIDDRSITIKGGTLRTVTCNPTVHDPNYVNDYYYFNRGIRIERSNTILENITYEKRGEHHIPNDTSYQAKGVPYTGTFNFQYCYNATFRNSKIVGHRAYSFFNEKNQRNEMGSYGLSATACINLNLIELTQTNDITDRVFNHGVMGSNFCRNILMDGCYMDRFDAHQGLHNATIKNSTLGFGILVIGGGTLTVENVERLSGSEFILLREDYNSIFDGDIIIKNCTAGKSITRVVKGRWVQSHHNGLDNWCVRNITVENLTFKNKGTVYLFEITNLTYGADKHKTNPFFFPESITLIGVTDKLLVASNSYYNQIPTTRTK